MYKWRDNLTLKQRFKKEYNSYTCIHDDTPSYNPCQHPSHYEGQSIYLTLDEIGTLLYLFDDPESNPYFKEDLQLKLRRAQEKLEYPYEEGI